MLGTHSQNNKKQTDHPRILGPFFVIALRHLFSHLFSNDSLKEADIFRGYGVDGDISFNKKTNGLVGVILEKNEKKCGQNVIALRSYKLICFIQQSLSCL